MFELPPVIESLMGRFSIALTRPTFKRFRLLAIAAMLTPGKRTILNMLWTVRCLLDGDVSSYHRVLSKRVWSLWPLGKVLTQAILTWIPEGKPVVVAMDDHAILHKGPRVYGKGKHRDAVRSTHGHTVWLFGHKWVILAVCVKFDFVCRAWALPTVCALYRSLECNADEGRRHKTPIQLARGLMATLCRWFPLKTFVFVGDGGLSSHPMARYAYRHRRRMTFIGKFPSDAVLHDPPQPRKAGQVGRPRVKGARRLSPRQVVEQASCVRLTTVDWYGGSKRRVGLVSGAGHWYKGGEGLVPIRWVWVHDCDGTHREEYFFSTDWSMTPEQIVSFYTARWPIETTFQESNAHLGLATPRCWSKQSVLRAVPCLLGLFSVVALIFAELHRQGRAQPRRAPGYVKVEPTFADALACVRRELWRWILIRPVNHRLVSKPPPPIIHTLLDCLSYAA